MAIQGEGENNVAVVQKPVCKLKNSTFEATLLKYMKDCGQKDNLKAHVVRNRFFALYLVKNSALRKYKKMWNFTRK